MTTAAPIQTEVPNEALERAICEQSFAAFLEHVYIPDPPPAGTGIVKFQLWPHLMRLNEAADALPPSSVLPVLKARKLGVTSLFEARFVWQQYRPGGFLPVISQGEKEAKKVISDCKFIWEHLPGFLQVDLARDNLESLVFANGVTIEAFPSTAKAGRSYTGTEILFDEADFHDSFGASYEALLPLIGDTGGKMFAVSTANPDLVASPFRHLYIESPHRIFLGYYDRPGRTEERYTVARSQSLDDARFEKENAVNETQALAPPKARAYFDMDVLEEMEEDLAEPREHVRGLISIWRKPAVAGIYVLGSDTAWGKTGSYNTAAVLDWHTGTQMAELHSRLDPDEMAEELMWLHRKYNHCLMGLERAGEGQERDGESVVVVDRVVELLRQCSCTGKLYYHDHGKNRPKTPGWQTDPKTRPVMLAEFAEAVRNRHVTIRSRRGHNQMLTFMRNDAGRPEASGGAYDDLVISYAIAWQMRKHVQMTQTITKVISHRPMART